MSPDVSKPIRGGNRPNWDLPEIQDIQIRRVPFRPPERRNFESSLAKYKEAVEFLVSTDGSVPARALGPVLFVGDVKVIESQEVDKNLYRFLVFDFDHLRSGAPISWSWLSEPKEERRVTRFRYELNQ